MGVAVLPNIINIDEIWMGEHRRCLRFMAKAAQKITIGDDMRMRDLNGDAAIEPEIAPDIDAGHTALADFAL
jgi:hypothetical protein